MRNKFLLLTTTSLISTFLIGATASHASSQKAAAFRAAKKNELLLQYRNGVLSREQVEQQAARFKIPGIAQDLFPPHWEQFFTYFNSLTYPQLLTACDQLSQGTLAQGFAGPVQANLTRTGNRGVHTLRGWLTAARDEVMNGPLKGFAERRQQLDHYIAAAEISERLAHTINADDQARIFATIKTGQPLDAALQQSLGNIQYKGHNITPLVATEILNNHRARPQAETEAKITQEITLLLNANLGLDDDICTRVANDVVRNNRTPVDSLTAILNYGVEGHDITRAVANKVITGRTPLPQALCQTRIEKYTELLRAKNYALTNAQYNNIAVALEQGRPAPAAFQSVLNVDACEGQDIKNAVVTKMITDNISFAAATREVIIATRSNRLRAEGWDYNDEVFKVLLELCNDLSVQDSIRADFLSLDIKEEWIEDFSAHIKQTRTLPQDAKEGFVTAKIQERLRQEHPNINHDDVIQFLARTFVRSKNLDALLEATQLREALVRTKRCSPDIVNHVSNSLLSGNAHSMEDAIHDAHVHIKAAELKKLYNHLPEDECLSLAHHLVGHPARIIKVALSLELAKQQMTNRNEIEEIIRLVLEEKQTIAQAKGQFGYRALMQEYPDQLTEEQARLILRECPVPLAGSKDGEFTFAKYVVEERYGSTHFQFKLDSVKRLISILHNDYNKTPLDIKKPHEYQGAHSEREAVYNYMRSKGYNIEADQDFARACTELKRYLPNNTLNEDEGLNYGSAFDIYQAKTAFKEDRENFSRKHEQHRQTLIAAITPDPNLNDRAAFELTHDSFDRNLFRRNLPLTSRRINLLQDFQEIVGEVLDIDARHSHEPIRLNYIGLTFEDIYSAALHVEYDPITDVEFDNFKNNLRNLLNRRHGHYDIIHQQFNHAFDRFSEDRDNQWKEKVSALLRRAPQNLVDLAIKRPDEEGYDAGRWQTDLENQKYTMLLAIIDTTHGCDTGVNLKLGKILDANQEHLGLTIPNMPVSAALARIINSLKLERIYELGEIFSINSEHYVTEPAVARQRMRIGFSLGGNYEELVHIGFGDPDKPKNFPIQIVRNMFVPGQPVRASGEDEDRISLPVRPHLTVKGLVDKVYGEFGKSITLADLNKMREGDAVLKFDSYKPAINGEEGVFNTCNPMNGIENMFFNRKMAFYLLEMHNYISINEEFKEVLYKEPEGHINHGGRQYTFDELIDDF